MSAKQAQQQFERILSSNHAFERGLDDFKQEYTYLPPFRFSTSERLEYKRGYESMKG